MGSSRRARAALVVPGLALLLLLVARPSAAEDRVKVVATTVQITALTAAVAGDRIDLRGIVPAGADPHEFEPIASDLVAHREARR